MRDILDLFFRRQDGNFAVMTALLMPLLLFGATFALDYAVITIWQRKLQDASDIVATRAAQNIADNMPIDNATQLAREELSSLLGVSPDKLQQTEISFTGTSTDRNAPFSVSVTGNLSSVSLGLTNIFSPSSGVVQASSTVGSTVARTGKPVLTSDLFVLQPDYSMLSKTNILDSTIRPCRPRPNGMIVLADCYLNMLELTKRGIRNVLQKFDASPEGTLYARTGSVSFEGNELRVQTIADQTSTTWENIKLIEFASGSDVRDHAVRIDVARKLFLNDKNDLEEKHNAKLDKHMIFFSSGYTPDFESETPPSITPAETFIEAKLRVCDAIKNDGIRISAMFMNPEPAGGAPNQIKLYDDAMHFMKKCASSLNDYYHVKNADDLTKAIDTAGTIILKRKIKLNQ